MEYNTREPDTTRRHYFRLSEDEIKEAICLLLQEKGVVIPNGKSWFSVYESQTGDKEYVLKIDEEPQ
jgi:hypothetical protein